MVKREKPLLDGPIPGQSLTSEPGARPWEQPAKYSTVEETLEFYIDSLSEPKKMANLLDKIEEGAPLTLIADSLQTLGVTKGLHSLDVGILISPVLIEFMKASAEQAEVDYTIGIEEEPVKNQPDEAMAKTVAKELYADEDSAEDPMPMEEDVRPEEPTRNGLMARKIEEPAEDGI